MTAAIFLDTNILLYAVGAGDDERTKREQALRLLDRTDAALSIQVLQEFYVQATRTSRANPIPHDIAVGLIGTWTRFAVQPMTLDIMKEALDIKRRYRLSYWDSAIVASAVALGCRQLYTEDLTDGQTIGNVTVINPFL